MFCVTNQTHYADWNRIIEGMNMQLLLNRSNDTYTTEDFIIKQLMNIEPVNIEILP